MRSSVDDLIYWIDVYTFEFGEPYPYQSLPFTDRDSHIDFIMFCLQEEKPATDYYPLKNYMK